MIWLAPSALFALAAIAVPVLIHILIQRRAPRMPFPTLRFLRPTRLAAIRRHMIDDAALLAIRIALVAAAVVALAGPLLVTAARRQAWDRRVVRAVVTDRVDRGAAEPAPYRELPLTAADQSRPLREEAFAAASLSDGIRRAALWLETAPPARLEIVVSSAFPIGSIAPADIAAVPAGIGVRLERSRVLPQSRTVPDGRILTPAGVSGREVTFDGERTSVREASASAPLAWPIEVEAPKADQPLVDAAVAAVVSQRVWAVPPGRHARLVLVGAAHGSDALQPSQALGLGPANASGIRQPWMVTAVARIAADRDLPAAGARVEAGLDEARFGSAPWHTLVSAADGRPLAAAAATGDRLLIASAAPASDIAMPLLLRAIANGIATEPDLGAAEIVPIPDATLRQWSRPASPPDAPRAGTIDEDDRRWFWIAALCLLGFEMWVRVAGARSAEHDPVASGFSRTNEERGKDARVA